MPLSKKQEDGLSLLSLIDGFRQDLSSALGLIADKHS